MGLIDRCKVILADDDKEVMEALYLRGVASFPTNESITRPALVLSVLILQGLGVPK